MSVPALRRLARAVLWASIGFHLVLLEYRLLYGPAAGAAWPLLALAGLTTWLSLLPMVEARLDAEHAWLLAQAQAALTFATSFAAQFEAPPAPPPRPVTAPPRGPQVN